MKKTLPFLVVLSLLIGIVVTVSTSCIVGAKGGTQVQNCGFSVSSQTDRRTTLSECLLNTYGWPLKCWTSGVDAILRDYHTVVQNNPANASSIIGYTSFSRLRFISDWTIWSIAAGILVSGVSALANTQRPQKTRSKKKGIAII